MTAVFHPDWKPTPIWWDDAPPEPADDGLPDRADIVVVGGGYCGLAAARTLARGGAAVAVLDAGDPGYGASTRNHGMVSGGIKIPPDLEAQVGPDRARSILQVAFDSYVFIKDLIRDEVLAVEHETTGRFIGAHSPAAYRQLEERASSLRARFGYRAYTVPRAAQRQAIGSDFYYGGMVLDESGGLQPAKLHRAFRRLATAAGARIHGRAEVLAIEGGPSRFTVRTARGALRADRVLIATNAYTYAFNGTMSPYVRRRLIPVTAYMIATEPLPPDLAAALIPGGRMGADTKRSLFAFRLSPDRRRMIFAGRAAFRDIDERAATPILHRFMSRVWPELAAYRITHSWKGLVGFTFDRMPHMGVAGGVHFVAGCQANGVCMMPYLGHQMALKMLSGAETQCGFDGLPFPSRPGYTGWPWFMPAIGGWYKARDAVDRLLARALVP